MKPLHPGCYRFATQLDLAKIRHIAFDLDGTLYRGHTLFDYTKATLDTLDSLDIGYTYLTNNSSLSAKDYLRKITKLGLSGTSDNIFTSSLATISYLKKHHPVWKKVYVLGTQSLRDEFVDYGYTLATEVNGEEPELVIVAFDTTLTFDRLCKAAWWVKQGKPYIATHPDKICPTDLPLVLVDCGAVCACIENATGREPDIVFGKPDRGMIDGIIEKHGLQPDEIAMVGDRLYTDMEMARHAGIVGVLVLSGEATLNDFENSGLSTELVVDHIVVLAELLKMARKESETRSKWMP